MDKEFWLKCWHEHQIGFHKNEFNNNLLKYFDHMQLKKSDHIFVPLCGKSLDMVWLRDKGFKVTGIELSPIAIEEFFDENGLTYRKSKQGKFTYYIGNCITLIQGDIFDLEAKDIHHIDGIYDRAATIALPEDLRSKYLLKLKEVSDNLDILMILLDYDQSLVDGPPFAVSHEYINKHFQKFNLKLLDEHVVENIPPKFSEAQTDVIERVYLIKK